MKKLTSPVFFFFLTKKRQAPFAENSWYFRNALVRANYNDWQNGIHETTKFLDMFFENLLMGKNHKLKNRFMHIDFQME